jgi:hypothetical protein
MQQMTVADLIRELQSMPPHAQVRVAMDRVIAASLTDDEDEIVIDQQAEAQAAREVRYEGLWVGIYA